MTREEWVRRLSRHVRVKLTRVLGEERGEVVALAILRDLQLPQAISPEERLKFGAEMAKRGGIYSVVGRSIQTQALLHGAKLLSDSERP